MAKRIYSENKSGRKRAGLILTAAVCAALTVGGMTAGLALGGCADKPVEQPAEQVSVEVPQAEFVFADVNGECVLTEYTGEGGEVIIPETHEGRPVTAIGECAFMENTSITSVVIPDSVTAIGSCAFEECTGLESIVIPEGVRDFGFGIFDGCSSLVEATVGENVMFGTDGLNDGRYLFSGCSGLRKIHVKNSIYCKDEDGVVYSQDGTTLLCCPLGREGELKISPYATIIDDWALAGCSKLTSIKIENQLVDFDASFFAGCDSLFNVDVPEDHVKYSSADGVLYSKDGSEIVLFPKGREGSFAIPDEVTFVGSYAFSGCGNLNGITVPEGVVSIGDYAFSGCGSVSDIAIPSSVKTVGSFAFEGCQSVTVSDSLADFGIKVFADTFTSVKMAEDSKKFRSVDGVIYSMDGKTLVYYPSDSENSSYIIPDGVKTLGDYAFYRCDALTSVTIPSSVRTIGDYTFAFCNGLAEISIPEGVTHLGDFAFSSCKELRSVSVPASVAEMSGKTFARLESVIIFDGLSSIDVAQGSRYYKSVDGAVYTKDGRTLVRVPDTAEGCYDIPEGVTAIGEYAFYGCKKLTGVGIPEGVTTIGEYAFFESALQEIRIPKSITEIREHALGYIGTINAPHGAEHYGYMLYDVNEWVVVE